jgi:hypothetical protein
MKRVIFSAGISILFLSFNTNRQAIPYSPSSSQKDIPPAVIPNKKTETGALAVSGKGGKIYHLPPDQMPCLVPNDLTFDKMSISKKSKDNMPNAIPEKKIIP